MELLSVLRSLARPVMEAGLETFNVVTIVGTPHRFGKDSAGAPVLLISTLEGERVSSGPIVLQHITVQHDVRCRTTSETGRPRDELVSLVRCTSAEPTLREYFVRVAEMTALHLESRPSRPKLNSAIKRLTELFRAFEQPARRTVQGLWSELLIIVLAERPEAAVAAWHAFPGEPFDFGSGPTRLEVKSFAGEARVHYFSLRQTRPGSGVDAVVASIRAERSSGGISISDLLTRLAARNIPVGAMEKVELVVAESLGDSAPAGLSITYDFERARESILFFDCLSIPSIDPRLPQGVLSVRFESLLDEHVSMPLEVLGARAQFFRDIAPIR
jgi:hypothetical protein